MSRGLDVCGSHHFYNVSASDTYIQQSTNGIKNGEYPFTTGRYIKKIRYQTVNRIYEAITW